MGRFESLVDSPSKIELFKEKYHIPQEVGLRYCSTEQIVTNREVGEVIILIIAFIEGGMTLPIGRITRDYLINHRLCSHQCAPNMFRILGCVDALNEHFQLGFTWHDVVHMYESSIPKLTEDSTSNPGQPWSSSFRASLSPTKG